MAPVLSLAPVTVVAISHPVIALTLLMAKKINKRERNGRLPISRWCFPEGRGNLWRRGVIEEGQSVGIVPVFIHFRYQIYHSVFGLSSGCDRLPCSKARTLRIGERFPKGSASGVSNYGLISCQDLPSLSSYDAVDVRCIKKKQTKGGQGKTLILVWNNWLLSPSIHCTFYKSLVTLHLIVPFRVEHWLCNYMSC